MTAPGRCDSGLAVAALLAAVLLAACGDDDGQAGPDASVDAAPDVEVVDTGVDAADAEVDAHCPWPDLEHAPEPVTVDGLPAVPVDVLSVSGDVVLDATAQTAQAQAVLTFRLGPHGGMPVLDLRQHPGQMALDGAAVSPAEFGRHDFGAEAEAGMRVLERDLPACSEHTLTFEYALDVPDAPEARPIGWDGAAGAVRWDFWFTDIHPGRYLEMWLPANLVYDRFTLDLSLAVHSAVDHALITNGDAVETTTNSWIVTFPDYFTALSPMVVVRPAADLVTETRTETFVNGQTLDIELYRLATVPDTQPPLMDRVVTLAASAIASTGDYPHGDRLVVYVWDEESRAMEYDGGTTTFGDALEHELFHSWFGRGVRPALGRDGWLDEAWVVYNTDAVDAFTVMELPSTASAIVLDNGDPWSRTTSMLSFHGGLLVFGHLAYLLGLTELRGVMAGFFDQHVPDPVTTAELEAHLFCSDAAAGPEVAQAFWRWVYGQPGQRDPATYPSCP